jgi:hypothetical protein
MTTSSALEGTVTTEPSTIVVFRLFPASRGGGVIALFPCEPGSEPWLCSSFWHFGQNGDADLVAVMNATEPAAPEQYAALKQELEQPPYNYVLDVRQRSPRNSSRERAQNAKKR